MQDILDISVINIRKIKNEHPTGRTGRFNKKVNDQIIYPKKLNTFEIYMNHRRHEGKIYREAVGGFETKGKPRYHPDWFE